jgi:hypothetical protein
MAEAEAHEGLSERGPRRHPHLLVDDPELVFPLAEGDHGERSNTYAVAGRLRGATTGHRWAFLVLFATNGTRHGPHADFHTLAFFDLENGAYGTSTELDGRRWLRQRPRRLTSKREHLDVTFRGAHGESAWRGQQSAGGVLVPFTYTLSVAGRDAAGKTMRLQLELDAGKPPVLVGGDQFRGVVTWLGEPGTHSYFQSAVASRGTLTWGEARDEAVGDCGWIEHQWEPQNRSGYPWWRRRRYRSERLRIHLDGGTQIAVWTQFDRRRANRVVPFSGATAVGPRGDTAVTTAVEIERLSFARDPAEIEPLYPLPGPRYFGDRHRVRIPSWNLNLVSEPLVAAPAHRLPIEYWNGPTQIRGTVDGQTVAGFGFHERTLAFSRDFELVEVLRQSLRQLPPEAAHGSTPIALADLAWEIDAILSRRDHQAALRYLNGRVRPEIERLAQPHRDRLCKIADDTGEALLRWWVRP